MTMHFEELHRGIKILLISGGLLLSVLFGLWFVQSAYFPTSLRNTFLSNSERAQQEISPEEVLLDLAKVIDVPEDETPTVATVSDVSKLAGQPFFAKALVGDKVIFYPAAQKAILYRPNVHKVIEVASLKVALDTASAPAP